MISMRTDKEMFRDCFVEKTTEIIRRNLRGLTLDLGSFDGLVVAPHKNAIGLDIKPTESYVPLVVGDMHNLPFKNEVFDTVSICHVLEHSEKPEAVLEEMKRVLKNNRKCIIVVPNAKAPLATLARLVIGYDGYAYPRPKTKEHWGHKSFFGYEDLKMLVEKSGFKISKTYGSTSHCPIIEKIFNYGLLRKVYCVLGDIDKKRSKDLIFVCRNLMTKNG